MAKIKAECLRLSATLKLGPARTRLIGDFIDSYLKLTAQELKQYERAIEQFAPPERSAAMEITTSWEQMGLTRGKTEGRHEGKESLIVRLLRRRVGPVPDSLTARLDTLTPISSTTSAKHCSTSKPPPTYSIGWASMGRL